MTPEALDQIFPYVCFAYGALISIALHIPALERVADQRLPLEAVERLRGHRVLGLVCLAVGAAWILQNLWL